MQTAALTNERHWPRGFRGFAALPLSAPSSGEASVAASGVEEQRPAPDTDVDIVAASRRYPGCPEAAVSGARLGEGAEPLGELPWQRQTAP